MQIELLLSALDAKKSKRISSPGKTTIYHLPVQAGFADGKRHCIITNIQTEAATSTVVRCSEQMRAIDFKLYAERKIQCRKNEKG